MKKMRFIILSVPCFLLFSCGETAKEKQQAYIKSKYDFFAKDELRYYDSMIPVLRATDGYYKNRHVVDSTTRAKRDSTDFYRKLIANN